MKYLVDSEGAMYVKGWTVREWLADVLLMIPIAIGTLYGIPFFLSSFGAPVMTVSSYDGIPIIDMAPAVSLSQVVPTLLLLMQISGAVLAVIVSATSYRSYLKRRLHAYFMIRGNEVFSAAEFDEKHPNRSQWSAVRDQETVARLRKRMHRMAPESLLLVD